MYDENKEMERSGHGLKYEMSNHPANVKRRYVFETMEVHEYTLPV
jgi:hypothetical protein